MSGPARHLAMNGVRPRRSLVGRAAPVVVGVLLLAGSLGVGTVASFTASTDNATGSAFSTGSLVLRDDLSSGSTCISTDDTAGPNGATCAAFFAVALRRPGQGATVDVDLTNGGSRAGVLGAHATGACVDSVAPGATYRGSASLCANLRLSVQQYTSAAARLAGTTTGGNCLYGGGTAEACTFADPTKTVAAFASAYPSFTSLLALGPMATTGSTSTRFLRISVLLDGALTTNAVQGRSSAFGITWRMVAT